MAYNLSFGLQSILKDSGIKTLVLSVETGSLDFIKSDGTLNVCSDDDSLRVVNKLTSNISMPFNFSLMGSDNEDLKFTAKWLDKDEKPLLAKVESTARFLYFLAQNAHKLPENPPARNHLIYKNNEDYHDALREYIDGINTAEEFEIFKGAVTIDFTLLDTTPSGATASIIKKISDNSDFGNLSGMNAPVEAILNSPQSDNLNDYFSQPEKERPIKVKLAIKSLCAHIWYSISGFAKDSISKEVSRRRQLRFLVSMLESYHKLEMYCALKKRSKSVTIKSQVTNKILKKSNGGINKKELTLMIQRAKRIKRVLDVINHNWKVLDSVEILSPSYCTSFNCQKFEIWLELVKSGKMITLEEAEENYKSYKQLVTEERINIMRKAFEEAGENFVDLSIEDFEV